MSKWIYMFFVVLALASCGGGSGVPDPDPGDPDPIIPTPAAPQRGTGSPEDVDYGPPAAGGADWGSGVYTLITFTSAEEFDIYTWNDAEQMYSFVWEFHAGTRGIAVRRTPGKTYDLHIQSGESWVRYDLVEGQTTLEVE